MIHNSCVNDSRCEIYVDGSFINGATGYGAVILRNGEVLAELSGAVEVSEVAGTRQVAGELVAVKQALNWCRTHSVKEVSIYYDYFGIEKWATGQWKTNQPLTREYARFVASCAVKIRWHKVASHTGDKWNDRADLLAKQGAAITGTQTDPAQPPSQPRGGPITGESDLMDELMRKTDGWIDFLGTREIEAHLDRIYNGQFTRVYIIQRDKQVGTFDLYNTKKKRLSPYLHNFRDEALKRKIEVMWKQFVTSGT